MSTEQSKPEKGSSSIKTLAIVILIGTCVVWGTSFITTKIIVKDMPVFLFLGIRFSLALLLFVPFIPRLRHLNKRVVFLGILAGFVYWVSIAVQTIGLQTTTAGKGGFITGLSTIIVPFIAWLGLRKPIEKKVWCAVGLSIVGMALLLLEGTYGLVIGDFYVLICAFGFALYIILVDRDVKKVDIYLYLIVQLFIIALLSLLTSAFLKESVDGLSTNLSFWLIMIYMGVIVGGGTFLTQNWGQKHVDPAHVAVIFTLEPVFAMLFGIWIGNESMNWQGWLGCALIFSAIFITSIKFKKAEKPCAAKQT